MSKEEKRINYLLDTIIECPSIQADELGKRIRRLFKTIDKQQKEIEEKERQLKIKNEYLQLAHDIAFDYDGCNTTESLKSLIDEIVELINKAYKNDDNSIIYIGGNSRKFNILHKEVENE